MFRSDTCGALRLADVGREVALCGWVAKVRRLGSLLFVDLRDRYGITQLAVDEDSPELLALCESLGREFVVQAHGVVRERESKNGKLPTGDIEIALTRLRVLNASETPPFTIETETDGGNELRMRYR